MNDTIRLLGGGLIAAGAVAAGAVAGAIAERAVMSRGARPAVPDEFAMGTVRGEVRPLTMADGTELHVEVDEAEADPLVTVIFCHGYSLNLDSWHYQRLALRGRARLVFYDQRSHGRSSRADFDSHHVDQLGADLYEVIEHVAPEGPLMLVGHSMGGMTIMALADQHPELFGDRIYGVALLATTPGGLSNVNLGLPPAVGRVFQAFVPVAAQSLARRKDVVERGRRGTSDLSLMITRMYSFGSRASDQAGAFVAAMISGTPIDVLAEFLPALNDHDKRAVLPVLQKTEVLVIVGGSDRLTPVEHSAEIVRAVPGAEFVVIKDSGHMVNIEHHEQVDALLIELLERVQRDIAHHVGAA